MVMEWQVLAVVFVPASFIVPVATLAAKTAMLAAKWQY